MSRKPIEPQDIATILPRVVMSLVNGNPASAAELKKALLKQPLNSATLKVLADLEAMEREKGGDQCPNPHPAN